MGNNYILQKKLLYLNENRVGAGLAYETSQK